MSGRIMRAASRETISAIRCIAEDLIEVSEDAACARATLYVNVEDGVPYWEILLANDDGTYSSHYEFPGRTA